MQVRRQGEWLTATIGAECVMMSVDNGSYISLSRVGTRIWELIEQPLSTSDLCERLVHDFDVTPELCRSDVDSFLAELEKHGAVSLDG